MTVKRFKQYLKEETTKVFYIDLDPYTEQSEIKNALTEITAWCLFQTARGQSVVLSARPYSGGESEQ
jgi:hypothetical protein